MFLAQRRKTKPVSDICKNRNSCQTFVRPMSWPQKSATLPKLSKSEMGVKNVQHNTVDTMAECKKSKIKSDVEPHVKNLPICGKHFLSDPGIPGPIYGSGCLKLTRRL